MNWIKGKGGTWHTADGRFHVSVRGRLGDNHRLQTPSTVTWWPSFEAARAAVERGRRG